MKKLATGIALHLFVFGVAIASAAVLVSPSVSPGLLMAQIDDLELPSLDDLDIPSEDGLGESSGAFERDLGSDDYSDWRQAGQGDDEFDDELRTHVLRLRDDGSLPGRLSIISSGGGLIPIDDIFVRFLNNQGEIAAETRPDSDGRFVVDGLTEGTYAMVAGGADGFIVYSIYVEPAYSEEFNARRPGNAGDVQFVKYQIEESSLEVDATAVPPADFPVVYDLLNENLQPRDRNNYIEPEEGSIPDVATPRGNDDDQLASARAGTTVRTHDVYLGRNGELRGRVRNLHDRSGRPLKLTRMNIYFIYNNGIVAQVPIDQRGLFEVEGLRPGVHSVVAAGSDGFLAFSVNIRRSSNSQLNLSDAESEFVIPMALKQGGQFPIDASLVSSLFLNTENFDDALQEWAAAVESLASNATAQSPLTPSQLPAFPGAGAPVGGGPGGFGGGGGFGTGGEFLSQLATLGIAGLTASEIADAADDDDDPVIASPAIP